MICINHPIYPSGTMFQSAFRMEWFITMLNCGPDMPISTKNQFFNKGCQGHITLLNTLKDPIPDPTLGLHLLPFQMSFGDGPKLDCPFDKNMVVAAMNHVWKKKQDVQNT